MDFVHFLSDVPGTKGRVKSAPEDFVVTEITSNGTRLEPDRAYAPRELGERDAPEGKATRFVLQKRDWETVKALIEIAKRRGRGKKSIGYSGIKDRNAVSVQIASIFGVTPDQVTSVKLDGVAVNGAWRGDPLELGSNVGNGFAVQIREAEAPENAARTIEQLDGKFPNYFDRQRFGYRLNNFKIGLRIIKDDLEGAMMAFLTDTENEDNADATAARGRLVEEQDYKAALAYFPAHLRYERTVIDYMARYNNCGNALRKLPRGILLLFIHAVESGIFNTALERRVREGDFEAPMYCGTNAYGFPNIDKRGPEPGLGIPMGTLIGYETQKPYISEYESEILERLGIAAESFKLKSMPELSMKGTYRALLSPVKALSCAQEGADLKLDFEIPSGSYATILINEITKTDSFSSSLLSGELV